MSDYETPTEGNMKDAGQAFPMVVDCSDGSRSEYQIGMSLRDYFAAKAMQVEIETACRSVENAKALADAATFNDMTIERRIAFNAYLMADAMIEARES